MGGTLERVTPTLTSDPPLSALQILNLLAGADEATVAAMTSTRSNEAQLAASGAATLAAGRISEEVGLERGAEKLPRPRPLLHRPLAACGATARPPPPASPWASASLRI